jgi:aspartate kinase
MTDDAGTDASPSVQPPTTVFKFGGTSVGSAERFRNVVEVVTGTLEEIGPDGRIVAVVSALSKVTRQLSAGLEAFATHTEDRDVVLGDLIHELRERHLHQAQEVLSAKRATEYKRLLSQRLRALRGMFARVERTGFSPEARDAILATGEQMSVPMVTLALRDAGLRAPHCDATALVVTDDTFGEANVDVGATTQRIRRWYASLPSKSVPVVAGFIGATAGGQTTTLGFEGSDYSAALVAQILGAQCLARYTDVDGLYTEDPNTSADAERLDEISMETAFAMTESGHLGMHPKTLRPLAEAGIPMQIRSIARPTAPGTRITPEGAAEKEMIPRRTG